MENTPNHSIDLKVQATSKFAAVIHKLHLTGHITDKERDIIFIAMASLEIGLEDKNVGLLDIIQFKGITHAEIVAFTNSDQEPGKLKNF